jgi:hypothetical protein
MAIKKEIAILRENIASGECIDYPSYKKAVGIVHGLEIAESIIVDTEAKILRSLVDDD